MRRLIVAVAVLVALSGCASAGKARQGAEVSEAKASRPLTREEAAIRARQVSRVAYVLWFDLDAEHPDFQGRAVINFDLRDKADEFTDEVFLDFEGGTIQTLTVNEKPMLHADSAGPEIAKHYDGHRIRFALSELRKGANNRIEIAYSHPFSATGNGLHRFVDPSDSKVYLYSNSEPYSANQIFPAFDQPDLKGSYEVTVEAPADWEVVANTLEREVTQLPAGRKSWAFPPSPLLSTYIFALHAGPYTAWKADAEGTPMRLFARKSLAKHVDPSEWFEVTRQGLEFFSTNFGYPYPYSKYDQLLVPEFNGGAMENAGAVTFSESFVYRSRVTEDRRMGRAETILHEMAHMWFGNLVTMRWWNGLWLNESFASFAATWALDEATRFGSEARAGKPGAYTLPWQNFFAGMKEWAYWEDQLVTTHPIETSVLDTDQAFANFDGITYGKGAAVLKQLSFWLGEDNFREGLQRYFQRYALRNVALADFMRMLGEASGTPLTEWQRLWLQTSGVNTIEADWSCDGGELEELTLLQSSLDGSPLRPHRMRVALYKGGKAYETFEISTLGAETEIPDASGKPCPDFVFPNEGDHDYVKMIFDDSSLKAIHSQLSRIPDGMTRQMLWHALWEMVVDGHLPAHEFADIVMAHAASEKNTAVLRKALRRLATPSMDSLHVLRLLVGTPHEKEYRGKITGFLANGMRKAPAGSDLQLVWYGAWQGAASGPESVELARGIHSGTVKLPGFALEQDRRWELVRMIARISPPESKENALELIAAERGRDATDIGRRESYEAEAAIADAETKRKWFALATARVTRSKADRAEFTNADLEAAMDGLYSFGQEAFARERVEPYFSALARASSGAGDADFLESYVEAFYPSLCEASVVSRTTEFLEANPGLPKPVVKQLRVSRQEEERCIRARKRASQSLSSSVTGQ